MDNKQRYILAIDAGTTSVRTLLYDVVNNKLTDIHGSKITQAYPHKGWVDQDANEIWQKIHNNLLQTLRGIDEAEIVGLGITNQRETVLMWDRRTGEPIAPAICWQDRRTEQQCLALAKDPRIVEMIHDKTGLFPNSYFSASKIKWLLDNCYEARALLEQGNLCCGNIDSYLVFRLTEGKSFVTDATNASRTMLFNIYNNEWDNDLLELFGVPSSILPTIIDSNAIIGETVLAGKTVRIGGILGDQQASLFGQACFDEGNVKCTYGTGGFLLLNVGKKTKLTKGSRSLTTIAWRINGVTTYAIEGSIYNAGSCVSWLEDNMHIIKNAQESAEIGLSVENTDGVYFVPALSGLGAPYWDGNAKGMFTGLTLDTTRAHVVRAVLESVCYNTRAIVEEMCRDSHVKISGIRVDGGMTRNPLVMQTQSDTLQSEIILSSEPECTSIGAAFICGLTFGVFRDLDDLRARYKIGDVYEPKISKKIADKYYSEWQEAVDRALTKD